MAYGDQITIKEASDFMNKGGTIRRVGSCLIMRKVKKNHYQTYHSIQNRFVELDRFEAANVIRNMSFYLNVEPPPKKRNSQKAFVEKPNSFEITDEFN